MVRSGSDGGRGRVRSQTYPPRPSQHRSESSFQSDRGSWFGNAVEGRRNSSPPRLSNNVVVSPLRRLEYGFGSGMFLQKRTNGGDEEGSSRSWSTAKLTRTPATPSSCESGGSASSQSGDLPRAPRRRHYRKGGWGKEAAPPTTSRQQRLVSCMIALVVFLGSIQIIALIVHPPRGTSFAVGGLGRATSASINSNSRFVRESAGGGKVLHVDGLRGGVSNNKEAAAQQQQHHGLSLSNPRAFELVTADMGHLKDTVEKLDLAFRETMGQQARDLAAVMNQLGVEPAARQKQLLGNPPLPKPVRGRGSNGNNKISNESGDERPPWSLTPPTAAGNTEQQQLPMPATTGGNKGGSDKRAGGKQTPRSRDSKLTGAAFAVYPPGLGHGVAAEGVVGASGGVGETKRNAGAVWNAYQRGKWVNGQWIPKVLQDDTSPDLSKLASGSKQQRRVLLLSERRSGGHAVGTILDADPRVFYVADPCRMGGGPEALESGACSLAVSRLLACQPTISDIRNLFSFSYIVDRSRVLSDVEGLRWQAGGTPEENDEVVRQAVVQQCLLSSVVIVKETRLAEVGSKLSAAELGTEFLHVVRDPRAAIHGMSERWQSSGNKLEQAMAKDCSDMASRVCTLTEKKLQELTVLGKEHFRVLKYEMFVEAPFAMTKSVYGWLQLGEFPQEVVGRIKSISASGSTQASQGTSHGPRAALGRFEWATRWAIEMPAFRRQQIQDTCQPLLVALRYDEADSFEEVEQVGGDGQGGQGPESSPSAPSAARDGFGEGGVFSRGEDWRASSSASFASRAAPVVPDLDMAVGVEAV